MRGGFSALAVDFLYQIIDAAMKAKDEAAYKQLQGRVKDMASPKHPEMPTWENAFTFIARNYTVAVLGGNLLTMMKQPISVIHALPYVSKAELIRAAASFSKHPLALPKFVKEKSIMMRNRAESIEQIFADMAERGQLNKILKVRLSKKLSAMENTKQILDFTQAFMMKGILLTDGGTAGAVPYSGITGAVESGDLRRLAWSRYALRDRSAEGGLPSAPWVSGAGDDEGGDYVDEDD